MIWPLVNVGQMTIIHHRYSSLNEKNEIYIKSKKYEIYHYHNNSTEDSGMVRTDDCFKGLKIRGNK